jgi:tripartite-type tricarboxylate transporter receptor subunit TctC
VAALLQSKVAGKQLNSSVNNPSEALGFYEAGTMVPLVAFTKSRLPMFPDVPTLSEVFAGGKQISWSYFMQRSVVGAPGMSEEAQAYYTKLFTNVYNSEVGRDTSQRSHLWVISCLVMT